MSKQYPLFPDLTEEGEIEAQAIIDRFKIKVKKILEDAVEETMGEIYSDIVPYIKSDSWTNFKNDMMAGFKNYDNRKIQSAWDFKEIRQQIYEDFKEDIIKDLDQDNLNKIKDLEKQIEFMRQCERNRY